MAYSQQSRLFAEIELVKKFLKMTPEERKKEVLRQMYVELRAVEMERRERVALEIREANERERERREKEREEKMRQEAQQRAEEERRANIQKALERERRLQLKKERLQWEKVMLADTVPVKIPDYSIYAMKEEQQRRREEGELRCLPKIADKASPKSLTSEGPKVEEQAPMKTPLYNNWFEGKKVCSKPDKDPKVDPNHSTYLLFAAKPGSNKEEKRERPKSKGAVKWLQKRLSVDHWVNKYEVHMEKKREKRELKAEAQYAQWRAYKESRTSHLSWQYDDYTGGLCSGRNSMLKAMF